MAKKSNARKATKTAAAATKPKPPKVKKLAAKKSSSAMKAGKSKVPRAKVPPAKASRAQPHLDENAQRQRSRKAAAIEGRIAKSGLGSKVIAHQAARGRRVQARRDQRADAARQ